MTKLELTLNEQGFPECDYMGIVGLDEINHEPHAYATGDAHREYSISFPEKNEEEINNIIPCANGGCNLFARDHTSMTTIFLRLKRNCTISEVDKFLGSTKFRNFEKTNNIQSAVYIDTPEGYKVI